MMKRMAFLFVAASLFVLSPLNDKHASEAANGLWAHQTGRVADVYDVRAFGARGDGKTLDTASINKAIDAAAAAGGGTVRFPAGTYLSFSIHLKSNIALYLDQGATILAADPKEAKGAYDLPEPNEWDMYQDFGHSHWRNSLIWGIGLENVSILGPGLIDGKGLTRRSPRPRRPLQPGATPATLSGGRARAPAAARGRTAPPPPPPRPLPPADPPATLGGGQPSARPESPLGEGDPA